MLPGMSDAPFPVVRELEGWPLGKRFLCRGPGPESFCILYRVDGGMRPSTREEFHEEVRKASARTSPSLVRVLATGEDEEGRFWIATEAVFGATVLEILQSAAGRGRRVPPAVAFRIAIDAARAADEAAREAGTAYRHLNGRNVRVDLRGGVRLDGLLREAGMRGTQDWT